MNLFRIFVLAFIVISAFSSPLDSQKHKWCTHCGMRLERFERQNIFSVSPSRRQRKHYCTLYCAVADGAKENELFFRDRKKNMPLTKTFCVLAPQYKPLIGIRRFFFFSNERQAQTYAAKHRGRLLSLHEAFKQAQTLQGTYAAMRQDMKNKKFYPIARIVLKRLPACRIDSKTFASITRFLDRLRRESACNELEDTHIEALGIYLWDTQRRIAVSPRHVEPIRIKKSDKCPVCGMFVAKYPRWAAQITYTHASYRFDGAKDLMKYYFTHKENIVTITFQDYYTLAPINEKEAYFVVGSDVYGPMGEELVPFATESTAKKFLLDHNGKKIVRFEEITPQEVAKLDE